ncbi:hypothetical protein N7517_003511 [Penicillium concentricum]|uniref:Metallo-beta-lactamase domain-containing protein n=1 Tax=Penicillium concentricum TaxID=293559 RepID=A0A9W9VM20_9EURO|nr:uncharacterized protein N7517_003511 [Penicillium concentricum]KAJ5385600.1 hypothetical protein N7517_003511 [Penicillium concentricum]
MSLPQSDHIVRVKLIDTTTYLTGIAKVFVEPVVAGHETFNFNDLAFLIENERTGKKVMFDLGTRKDYWNLAPAVQRVLGLDSAMTGMKVDKDVAQILVEGGVSLDTIGFLPGYPENPVSPVLASDFEGRELIEMSFENGLEIGGFRAHDYFGDGSLYLLDSPGHCAGHLSALARTTSSSAEGGTSFVFLGGDICHFAGDFRPSSERPLPDPAPESILARRHNPIPCPCSLTRHHPNADDEEARRTTPWYKMAGEFPTAYHDIDEARESVSKMGALDQNDDILVCLAHDAVLLDVMPIFNEDPKKDINGWRERGLKDKCHWGWLREIPIDGKPAQIPLVEGFWRDGKPWDYMSFKKTLTIPL